MITDDIIDAVLLAEGPGFTNRPADSGGPTCCGVTLATYAAYRAPLATTVDDLKRLTPRSSKRRASLV